MKPSLALLRRAAFVAVMVLSPTSWSAPAVQPRLANESVSPRREVAARFSVAHRGSGWWLVSPTGEAFFSLGVCCITQGLPREEYDPDNPGYAAWRHYADARQWADNGLRRLKTWRFTTAGAWSDHQTLEQSSEATLWLTPVLHAGSTAGAPWWDMWDTRVIRRMEETARPQLLALRDDPRLLGYYTDNELGWWNATLFKMTLEQAPTSGQSGRLIGLLRQTYGNDWKRLLADFDAENAASWSALERRGMLYLKPGGAGIKVMRRFLELVAERYYQLVHDLIRRYDTRALILGDRYQSFYYPEVARACARHVDVVSSNLNAQWADGGFLRCYLDTLHALTGRPILVSEVYMAATQNRSGNRNSHGIFPVAATQRDRAAALRRTLTSLLALPYVVGADWFQYSDEPTHGRDDGENFNFGLVDIHDAPYAEVTGVFAGLEANRIKAQPPAPRPDAAGGVPPAPAEPFAELAPTRALQQWDRERGFVKPASEFPMADLYLAWSPAALYLGLYALDIVEEAYYRDRSVPKGDRPQWFVAPEGQAAVRARIGCGREALVNDSSVRVECLSGLNLDVRTAAIMALPARRFGKERFAAGDTVTLSSTLLSHCQANRIEWRGQFTLRD